MVPAAFLCVAFAAGAPPLLSKDPGDAIEQKLYAYVRSEQIRSSESPRNIGAWPDTIHFHEASYAENDVFLPLLTLIALEDVSRYMDLPGLDQIIEGAEKTVGFYQADARETNEPAGTLSWWPLWHLSNGKTARSFSAASSSLFQIPNDFDDAALASRWFSTARRNQDFTAGFIQSLGGYRDLDRKRQATSDERWKQVNSGAFLTWAERELVPGSRIHSVVNDVDCVVNLNILGALGLFEKGGGSVPETVKEAERSACSLVASALATHKTASCAMYYTRTSQFLLAYARASEVPVDCLKVSAASAATLALRESEAVLNRSSGNTTEVAELMIALKKLHSPPSRTVKAAKTLQRLAQKLQSGIIDKGTVAYVPSVDSLCTTSFTSDAVWWSSPAFGSVLALQALVLP